MSEAKIDRSRFTIVDNFAVADQADREYWWSRTPEERWEYMEVLRRLNYGDEAFEGLSRVFEIAWRE